METIDILLVIVAFVLLIAVLVFLQPSELQVEIGRILKFIFKGNQRIEKSTKKDQQEIASLIRRYNKAVTLALNHGDFGKTIDLCTGQGYGQILQLYNDHYKDHQVKALLKSLEIISVDLAGSEIAKVDTREKWRYEYIAGDCSERECVNSYQLRLLDDVWKVDKVEVFVPS